MFKNHDDTELSEANFHARLSWNTVPQKYSPNDVSIIFAHWQKILAVVTVQLADTPTRGLDISRTGQLAD